MFISFIIPTYNYGHYITNCLDSILEQERNDCEIIVVDDGSTDNTRSIIGDYARNQADGRIRYLYQVNKGPSAARNVGATQARGKYVWFVDSDDRLVAGALDHVHAAIETFGNPAFIFGSHVYVNEKGRKTTRFASDIGVDRNENFTKFIRKKVSGISIGSLIVRQDVFGTLRFPEGIHNNEDNIFFGHLLATRQGGSCRSILVEKIGHKDSLRYNDHSIKETGLTVDRLFDDRLLNEKQMSLRNIYLSDNYYALFRTRYRNNEYKEALLFYRKSIVANPFQVFSVHRFKQAIRCFIKALGSNPS
ncbi:MAG: glycosyltransferase family 2 protein [Pedobacter sp.]